MAHEFQFNVDFLVMAEVEAERNIHPFCDSRKYSRDQCRSALARNGSDHSTISWCWVSSFVDEESEMQLSLVDDDIEDDVEDLESCSGLLWSAYSNNPQGDLLLAYCRRVYLFL